MRRGVTLVELLLVLAMLALFLSLALAFARPSHAVRAGDALRTALIWARATAIWLGESVAVTELADGAGFVVRAAAIGADPCPGGRELSRVRLADHPGVRIEVGLPRGIVWLPSGSGRSCDGGGVISGTVRLADRTRRVGVVVSSLGRVRLQVGP